MDLYNYIKRNDILNINSSIGPFAKHTQRILNIWLTQKFIEKNFIKFHKL